MEIRVAHSIFAFTSLDHNYDVSLKGVRVQELTSETVVVFISINLPYYLFLAPFFTISF